MSLIKFFGTSLSLFFVSSSLFAMPDMVYKQTLQDKKSEAVVYQKLDTSCGGATLSMLFRNFLNISVTEEEVISFVAQKRGQAFDSVTFEDMQDFANLHKYDGLTQSLSFKEMTELTTKRKIPFIVRLRMTDTKKDISQSDAKFYYHFVVVRGAANGLVNIADPNPSIGNTQYTQEDFLQMLDTDGQGKGKVFFLIPQKDTGKSVNKGYIKDPSYYPFDRSVPNFIKY